MQEFLSAILGSPTVVFTVALLVIVLYWLMVIVGAIGIDVLHIGEAAGGKIEGMLGGAVEGKIEGVVAGAVEGKVEGVLEGAALGKVEGMTGKVEAVAASGGFLAILGFGKIPATAVISSLVLWSWVFCILSVRFGAQLALPHWLLQIGAPVLAVFLAGAVTGAMVRVIGRFIVHHEPLRRADLVGKVCTITTGRVDANFGQGLITEHGVDLTVDVRCDPPNSLRRHARAVIISYDAEHNFFHVEAYDQPLAPLEQRTPAT